jgi:hypothetical protein
VFSNGFDDTNAVLRMADFLADVEGFDLHAGSL